MSVKKKQFNFNSPEVRRQIEEIQHGAFMRQGTMLAFPMGFPGATIPIVPDESRITALDATPEGIVYGGTSGKRSHIFVAMFHGVTGMVFDMKAVNGADQCPAVCCGQKRFLACLNGPRSGGRILLTRLEPLPYDLIQEWGFERPAFDDLGEPVAGEPIVHAVAGASREFIVGITPRHLFTVDFESGKIEVVGEVPGFGRLAVLSDGSMVGQDGTSHLWRYEPRTRLLHREAIRLPEGAWGKEPLVWARDPHRGLLYAADHRGHLFSYEAEHGFSPSLGQAMFTPVGPMAVTIDGRLFGFCGSGIAKMFCYDPGRNEVSDLGVAVSVFERRRYGYAFGDAVTGRDGEIIFGEDDDFGHLWLYFPRILTRMIT
jgi:hypothetical protein